MTDLYRLMNVAFSVLVLLLSLALGVEPAAAETGFREVWVFPEIHQDIGYTDTYDVTLDDMARCLETAVPFLEENPEATFWWENVYTLEIALERRPGLADRTGALIKEGRFGVGATYSGIDATATPGESIARTMTHAKWWMIETFGVEPKVATLIDMAGFPPQTPQILEKSGVDLLLYTRSWGPPPLPFVCVALDGEGIPACFVSEQYDFFGFMDDSDEPDLGKLEKILAKADPKRWTGGVLWGFNCGGGDNDTPKMGRMRKYIERWNDAHPDGPALRFGLPSELPGLFASAIGNEGRDLEPWVLFGQTWPVIKREEPVFRAMSEAERSLSSAESLAVFVDALGLAEINPRETERIWGDFLWAYEHNWGGRGGGGSDRAKLDFARRAAKDAGEVERKNLETLAGAIRCEGRSLIVYNQLGWSRSGAVKVELNTDGTVVDDDGMPVPAVYEREGDGVLRTRFIAKDIAAFGYRTYQITRDAPPVSQSDGELIEEDNVPRLPGFADRAERAAKESDGESTGPRLPRFGHMVTTNTKTAEGRLAAQDEKGLHLPADTDALARDLPSLGREFTLRGEVESSPYSTRLTEIPALDLWEVETEIDYVGVGNRCVFLPLPLDPGFSEVELGTDYGSWVSPAESHRADFDGFVPGAVFSPYTKDASGHVGGWKAQATPWRYYEKWFDVRDPETGEGVLVAAGENNQAFYRDEKYIALGLVQTLMFHDAWPRKTGIHRHRFAFRYHKEPVSNIEAARFGWETAMPLVATVVSAQREGTLPPAGSFLNVEGDVVVTALKPAHDGKGAVLRAYVPGEKPEHVVVNGNGPIVVRSMAACDMLERPVEEDSGADGRPVESLGGFEIGTYRLDLGRREQREGTR